MKRYIFCISQNYSFTILRPIQKILRQRGDEVHWFLEGNSVNPGYLSLDEKRLDTIDQVMQFHADATLAPAQSIPSFLPGLKVAIFHGFNVGKLDRRGNDTVKLTNKKQNNLYKQGHSQLTDTRHLLPCFK